jgi:hypothetical protein
MEMRPWLSLVAVVDEALGANQTEPPMVVDKQVMVLTREQEDAMEMVEMVR